MKILHGIAGLADRYDGFVLDLWGVVHDGRQPYPGVAEALGELKRRGKRVAFLSNAPRRAHAVHGLLTGMGLDPALWDAIVTSGELAWRALGDRAALGYGRRALHIGPERDLSVAEDRDIQLVSHPAEADWVLNTGPEPARGNDDVGAYRPMLEACAARRLPMLCANPDRYVMVGEERVICAGALADLYVSPRRPEGAGDRQAGCGGLSAGHGGAGHRRHRAHRRDRRQPAHRPRRRAGRGHRRGLGADRPRRACAWRDARSRGARGRGGARRRAPDRRADGPALVTSTRGQRPRAASRAPVADRSLARHPQVTDSP
jgi:HAD superfamily hydrolase (TIGR01459 family)